VKANSYFFDNNRMLD